MNLVKVEHMRCGEFVAYTLVWAPEEWAEQEVRAAVRRAQAAYDAVVAGFKQSEPPNNYRPYGGPPWDAYSPLMSLGEVRADWALKKQVWDEWKAGMDAATRRFGDYLKDEGLLSFWEHDPPFTILVDWGHRHGQDVAYSETKLTDLPGPVAVERDF